MTITAIMGDKHPFLSDGVSPKVSNDDVESLSSIAFSFSLSLLQSLGIPRNLETIGSS
jgi:hypothetical protein